MTIKIHRDAVDIADLVMTAAPTVAFYAYLPKSPILKIKNPYIRVPLQIVEGVVVGVSSVISGLYVSTVVIDAINDLDRDGTIEIIEPK